ncbi:hypothetical protein BSTEL_0494 [Bifidobacterium stellenboschense]|uniref:Uncharacterized protein n=2 Tax=Bifidobacterium stellenboschense TaxID=762211 RepID=A0A087DJI8_9BIFI|nr:hypothetical protein BSTEL_0494 [Bifidobacterium stellenboschense]
MSSVSRGNDDEGRAVLALRYAQGFRPMRMMNHDAGLINARLGTDFHVYRFRRPRRMPDGEWDCRFQLPVLVYRYGEVAYTMHSPHRMFDVRYLRANVQRGRRSSTTRLHITYADPLALHVADIRITGIDMVPTFADVRNANLLIEDDDDTADGGTCMPWVCAVSERRCGLVFPLTYDTQLTCRSRRTDGMHRDVEIGVERSEPYRYGNPAAVSVYSRYPEGPDVVGDEEVLARLEEDSALLHRLVMMRESEGYGIVTQALVRLRAENRENV